MVENRSRSARSRFSHSTFGHCVARLAGGLPALVPLCLRAIRFLRLGCAVLAFDPKPLAIAATVASRRQR